MTTFTLSKAVKVLRNPGLFVNLCREKMSTLAYHFGKEGFAFYPGSIKLYINTTCNCTCNFCDVGKKNEESMFFQQVKNSNSGDISDELIGKIITEFSYKPVINISGLEPLLHKDWFNILKRLKNNGFILNLVTNGTLLVDAADKLMSLNINGISVSLDGTEEVHDSIRGKGVYKKAIDGLFALRMAKKKYKAKTNIKVNCCVTNENYSTLEKFAVRMFEQNLSEKISFTYLYFVTPEEAKIHNKYFINIGKATATNYNQRYSEIDTHEVWKQIQNLKANFKGRIGVVNKKINSEQKLSDYYHSPEINVGAQKCLIPWKRITVLSDGKCIIHNRCFDYETGNLNKQSFKGIWNGERFRYFRKQLKANKIFPVCKRCCAIVN